MFWNIGNTHFLSPIIYCNYPNINLRVYIFYVPITIFLAVTIFFFHAVVDADYYLSRTVNVFLTWIQQYWAKNCSCIISVVKVNVFPLRLITKYLRLMAENMIGFDKISRDKLIYYLIRNLNYGNIYSKIVDR